MSSYFHKLDMIPQAFWNPETQSPHRQNHLLLLVLLLLMLHWRLHWRLHPMTFNGIHIEASRRDMPALQHAFDGVLTGSASSDASFVVNPSIGGSNNVIVLPVTAR